MIPLTTFEEIFDDLWERHSTFNEFQFVSPNSDVSSEESVSNDTN